GRSRRRRSFPGELRGALLQKRAHTFGAVVAREAQLEQRGLELEPIVQRKIERGTRGFLCRRHGHGTLAAMVSASDSARSSRALGSSTSFTKPNRSASSAPIISPVRIILSAAPNPTMRGRR